MYKDARVKPYGFTDLLELAPIRSVAFMVDLFVETEDFRVMLDYQNDRVLYEVKVKGVWTDAYWDGSFLVHR